MAEVRHRLGTGAYNFAQKTCRRYLLQSQNKRGNSATRAPSVSTELPVAESQNGGPYGAGDPEDGVTVGASQELYTKVTRLFETLENIKDDSPPHDTSGKSIERSYASFPSSSCSFSRLQSLGGGRPCWGQCVFIRAYSGNGTRSEPLYKSKTGYYEILEVTPAATHAQIKTAYYKQSFVYHPDRNAGSEVATVRFSEISEAYTVLGNKALRKKYDRGLLSQSDLVATARPSGKETTAKQQTDRRRSVMDLEARGGVFDFDTFFKSHYNEQLQREKDVRVRKEEMLRKKQETFGEKKPGRLLEMGVGLMVAFAIALLISLKRG